MRIGKITLGLLLAMAACDESPVSLPEPAGVTVAAATMSLAVGDHAPVAAQVLDQEGRVMQGQTLVFSTTDPSVATVDGAGVVHAVSPGTATVSAAYGSRAATVRVTVVANRRGELQAFEVLADSVVADVRAGAQALGVRASNGYGAPVCPQISFRSSDVSVATARMAGDCRIEVVPAFVGETTITAEAGGRTDTFRVRVTSTGAVAFFSTRPTAAELVAGDTVTYTVKVLNGAGNPVANQRVNLDVSAGAVTSAVTTDSGGTAEVQWILPTMLRELGHNQSISYRVPLAGGVILSRSEPVFINGAALTEIAMYRRNGSTFTRVDAEAITVPAYTTVFLGASGLDQYGNVTVTDFTFSLTGSAVWLDCGTGGVRDPSGIEYTCVWGYPSSYYGPAILRATGPGGLQKSLQLTFN